MIQLSLFTKARIKLTAYYTLIFLVISIVISGLFFYRTSQVLEDEYHRMEQRFQFEISGLIPQGLGGPRVIVRKIEPEDLNITKQKIIVQLLGINGLIIFFVAASGYLLSGITLAPIETSMKLQKRFVSDIAHEIKTPLTALKTSIEVNLMDPSLNPSIKTLLTENLEDVTHLDDLTTSMLRLSKNHDQPLSSSTVMVKHIVDQAVRIVKATARSKHITLVVHPIPDNLSIVGDKAALTDVIKILLDNAVKYSGEGTVTVTVLAHRQTVSIKVSDQGQGIQKADLEHIFDRFYRADASRQKSQPQAGYGLGLSIAKSIVDYHRGSLTVASTYGKGSVFTLSLPRLSQ